MVERVLSSECLAYIWLLGTPLTLALDANQVLAFISVFKQGLITVSLLGRQKNKTELA